MGLKIFLDRIIPQLRELTLGQSAQRFCHLVMSRSCGMHLYDFVRMCINTLKPKTIPPLFFVDLILTKYFDLDDATKVFHEDGTLQELGKSITQYNALEHRLVILDMQMLEISSALAGHQRQFGVPASLKPTKNTYVSIVNPLSGGRWQDVDNPAMFEAATRLLS